MTLIAARTTPCQVPPDFDHEAYGAVSKQLSPYSEATAWSSYAGGFNAVAFRFAAADEAHGRLAEALSEHGALSTFGPRFRQEEALFAFFVNAVSVIDCLYFSLYNIAACVGVSNFSVATENDLRRVHIGSVVKAFQVTYPKEVLTSELARVGSSKELQALKEYRDYLAHRGSPKRVHVVEMGPDRRVDMSAVSSATITSNPKSVPRSWVSGLELTPSVTAVPRAWLGITTCQLLRATNDFLGMHASLSKG